MGWPKKPTYDDGDSILVKKDEVVKVRLLVDEPETYFTHFVDMKSKKCEGDGCGLCAQGLKRNEKGSMLVTDLGDGKEKKLKGTAALFLALHESLELCGGRKGFIFAIKATGDKQQRRYHIAPLPDTGESVKQATDEEETIPF